MHKGFGPIQRPCPLAFRPNQDCGGFRAQSSIRRNLGQRGGAGPNGKPSKTLDEAATQLTRTGSTWSTAGQPVTVTYAFRATFADTIPGSDSDAGGFSRFNADQIRQTELAQQASSDVSGIRFSLTGAGIDRISDFNYAEGDRLKLEGNPARTIAQVGADVIVDMGNGDQVILVGVSLSSLGAGWIL